MRSRPWLFLAWAPYGRRSESLASEIGAKMHFIHFFKFQTPIYAPLKYVLQSFRTLFILLKNHPEAVFIQNPPIFCGLIAYFYGLVFKCQFVLDHHSDAFSDRWAWISPLQKFLVRHAVVNLVTSEHWVKIIESWGGVAMILEDALPNFPQVPEYHVGGGFNVVMINTFADDEPLDEVISAARQMTEIGFYVTGNKKKIPLQYLNDKPDNVTFTGFLPDEQYIGLLKASDAVLALTTRDNTLQGGGYEAVSLRRPLITSDWPLLHTLFQKGSLFVDNSPNSIVAAISEAERNNDVLCRDMEIYFEEKKKNWRESLKKATDLLQQP